MAQHSDTPIPKADAPTNTPNMWSGASIDEAAFLLKKLIIKDFIGKSVEPRPTSKSL